ncbi:MAG: RNA polymerase sigma-70 factor (sigma-E family) [Candidatus Aldehydirespiratoraceae bacterium]|jgi:RNA polymerase sigma-70 factor (sigma-E family)
MLNDDHFQDWFQEAKDGLVRYAYLCCGDEHLAEELVADAVARMWPAWGGSRIINPDGYVRRIIANRLTDRRRRSAVKRRVDDQLRASDIFTPDPSTAAVDQMTVWPLVLALPAKQRAVIVLRYFESRSEAEIAEILDLSPGTVKSRASRGLSQLRAQLEVVPHG